MKTRTILGFALVAGMATAAMAQPTATVTLNWKNTGTGGMDPIGPGQSAAIWVDVAFTPAVGTQLQTPLGTGEVAGLASLFFDLVGSGNTNGSWQNSGSGFGGTQNIDGPFTNNNWNNYGRRVDTFGGWALGGAGGQGGGTLGGTVHDYMAGQAGQFPLSPPANAFNPIREIFRAAWTPADFDNRTVSFDSRKAFASLNSGVAILVLLPGDVHTTVEVPTAGITWGSINIPVVPSPSSLALLGLGGLMVARRRR